MWRQSVVRPSLRKTHFLRTHQANSSQILWKGSCPPYLPTIFFCFSKFWIFELVVLSFSFSLTWGPKCCNMVPWVHKIKTLLVPHLFFFNQSFCECSLGSPHKNSYIFCTFKLIFKNNWNLGKLLVKT